MVAAIFITIFASFLWSLTNHIDKFMVGVEESSSSLKTLLVFSTLVAGFVFTPVWLVVCRFHFAISFVSLFCVFIAVILYMLGTYFYFIALDKNDASIVVVMFQLIPIFSYLLELVFFKEHLLIHQIVGSLVILLSAIIISIDFEEKNSASKGKALLFMLLSSLSYALYYFLFDIGIRNSGYHSCALWFQIGLLLLGIGFICIKSYRETFINAIKINGKKYISLNITNEILNLIAVLLANFANVSIPLALVNVLNGFQGAFVFILGVIGVKFLPAYFKEDLNKKVVIQKIGCILLSLLGLIIMFL